MTSAEIDAEIVRILERAGEPPIVTPMLRAIFAAGESAAARAENFPSPPWFAQYTRANMESQELRAALERERTR